MIEKLTEEQEDQLPIYRDKWLKIGLCTEPIDREAAVDVVNRLCTVLLEKSAPQRVFFEKSPYHAWLLTARLGVIEDLMEANAGQTFEEAEKEVAKSHEKAVEANIRNFIWSPLDGHMSAGFCSFYDYCEQVLKIDHKCPQWPVYRDHTQLGPVYCLDKFAVVSDRPREIHMKDGKLHRDGGPAIYYSDDFQVWSLNGVQVPQVVAETQPEQMTKAWLEEHFLPEGNAEVRREIVRKVRVDLLVSRLGAKVVDRKGDYELLVLQEKGQQKRPYLKMKNPSVPGVFHVEGIAPGIETVDDALKFRNKMNDVTFSENGADWYQQGDVIMVPKGAKCLKPNPTVLT